MTRTIFGAAIRTPGRIDSYHEVCIEVYIKLGTTELIKFEVGWGAARELPLQGNQLGYNNIVARTTEAAFLL